MSVLIKGMKMPKDGRRHKALVIFEPDGTCKVDREECFKNVLDWLKKEVEE